MRRLYRIYYTTYSEEEHSRVLQELRKFNAEVVEVRSQVVPEFRFVELRLAEPGKEEEIKALVSSIVGERVKVDWVDASR
ncbi:MAG: hypothetical protein N3D79_02445 [Acidilobaceae archaeon]|nr:hypothetical protein [Acidilobaceae archaeon]